MDSVTKKLTLSAIEKANWWLSQAKTIQAIKAVRDLLGTSLKDSKDFVEQVKKGTSTDALCGMLTTMDMAPSNTVKLHLFLGLGDHVKIVPAAPGFHAMSKGEVLSYITPRMFKAMMDEGDEGLANELRKMVLNQIEKALAGYAKAGKEANVQAKGTVTIFPEEQMESTPTKKLCDATMLYEPVQGSGHSSRYFVVGIGDGINLACRIKGNSMSLRVEGSLLGHEEMRSMLQAIGFMNCNEQYGSFHVDAPGATLQAKTVGATLLSISSDGWKSGLPDVGMIAEKGN